MSEMTPDQLRDAYEATKKENAKLQKAAEEALAEVRTLKAVNAVKDAGLSAELADLYIVANPEADITVESVKEFAEKYGIPASEATPVVDEAATEQPRPEQAGLSNFARAGSGAGNGGAAPIGTKHLTRDEFLVLQRDNPAAARQALAEGRVQLREDNPLAEGSSAFGHNPFLASRKADA